MMKLRVTGEIEVPDEVGHAIMDQYRHDTSGYLVYNAEFTAKVTEYTRHKVQIPIKLQHVIE